MRGVVLTLLLSVAVSARAQFLNENDVFLCVDDGGKKEYKSGKQVSQMPEAARYCKKIDLPSLTVVPDERKPEAKWMRIARGKDFTVYLDRGSLVSTSKYRKAWLMSSYDSRETGFGRGYQSSKELWMFRCTARQSALIQNIRYAEAVGGGAVLHTYAAKPENAPFEDVVPDSVGEEALQRVCAFK
jgi:hypothetical protein